MSFFLRRTLVLNKLKMTKIILCLFLIFVTLKLFAQPPKIITDRPGYTINPNTVPDKWVQSETGLYRQSDRYFGLNKTFEFQHPSLLTKYGIGNRVELRLILIAGSTKEEAGNGTYTRTGITSFQLGGKYNFLKEKKIRPNIALIAHYDFHRFNFVKIKFDTIDGANFRFAMEHTISKTISIGYNIGMEWKSFTYEPAYIYTLSPKFNITEKWKAFIEVFGYITKSNKPEHRFDGGIAYYVNSNLKLDAYGGFGLNLGTKENFYSIGASFRFKTAK